MLITLLVILTVLGFVGYGIYFAITGDSIYALAIFVIATVLTVTLATNTTLFDPNSLHISNENRQQFEDQIRDITSEEIVEVSHYDYSSQGELDVLIGDTFYVVVYDTLGGKATVKSIIDGNKVVYDRTGIEWNKEPSKEDDSK